MEPKNPIIIDGVDVSGCEFYCDKYCSLSNDRNEQLPFAEICSEYSDCMFKQLARKEQECERLKQTLTETIRFFKEDKKFARYSGLPIVFVRPAFEKIEEILKENDIKISEAING